MLADEDRTGTTQADAGWAVRIAVSSSARNGVVGVGGAVELPASAQEGPKLKRFAYTLGMMAEQNPFSGELAAISYTLGRLPSLRCRTVAVLTRNKAAVLSIRNPLNSPAKSTLGVYTTPLNLSSAMETQ